MSKIKSGTSEVEIDGIVAEAIDALGYFHPNSVPFVAARLARLWGENPYTFETDGERIKPIPERPRYQVAGEIWGCLSDKGRADPTHACKATLLRITFNVRRAAQASEAERWRSYATKAQFACHEPHACAGARAKDGAVVGLTKRHLGLFAKPVPLPPLPLAGCDAEWCSCRWDVLSD